jgi:hypothetical protein
MFRNFMGLLHVLIIAGAEPAQHSRDAGPRAAGGAGDVRQRGELSRMNCEPLAMRDGRRVFLDFKEKGNKVSPVAVRLWVKQAIDGWFETAGIEKGPIFRRVSANGRVGDDALTERRCGSWVREYAAQGVSGSWRRAICGATAAKLCRTKGASWSKFSFCLGHESILTTDGTVLGLRTGSEQCSQRRAGV